MNQFTRKAGIPREVLRLSGLASSQAIALRTSASMSNPLYASFHPSIWLGSKCHSLYLPLVETIAIAGSDGVGGGAGTAPSHPSDRREEGKGLAWSWSWSWSMPLSCVLKLPTEYGTEYGTELGTEYGTELGTEFEGDANSFFMRRMLPLTNSGQCSCQSWTNKRLLSHISSHPEDTSASIRLFGQSSQPIAFAISSLVNVLPMAPSLACCAVRCQRLSRRPTAPQVGMESRRRRRKSFG